MKRIASAGNSIPVIESATDTKNETGAARVRRLFSYLSGGYPVPPLGMSIA
jgi:hypothetical protein